MAEAHVTNAPGAHTATRLLRTRRVGAKLKIGQLHHPGDCEPFEVPIRLSRNKDALQALVDTGATGYGFIDASFAKARGYPLEELATPRHLQVIDGRAIASGAITHCCKLRLEMDDHVEGASLFVTKLGDVKVVLGLPWLQHHAAEIRFADRSISFHAERCQQHTATRWTSSLTCPPLTASAATLPPPPIPPRASTAIPSRPPPIPPRPATPAARLPCPPPDSAEKHNNRTTSFSSSQPEPQAQTHRRPNQPMNWSLPLTTNTSTCSRNPRPKRSQPTGTSITKSR
ncbi:uncharacterized protein LAJ45_06403 [Morchella importuna]|uniref:uncharacterized protein n=1 Tax=Morchella importuna TaxID=1174673 RepID=UPI001E8CF4CB|nr:uncharacterized protein LAJ45_06403 [Morchella importuna]KAH8149324.1 hypothetical protein LAJ45_06403 [Morchella importuna]